MPNGTKWYQLSAEEAFKELEADSAGISSSEAKARLEKYGYNELEFKKPSVLMRFLRQFNSPLVYVLLVAGAITGILTLRGEDMLWDTVVILGVESTFAQSFLPPPSIINYQGRLADFQGNIVHDTLSITFSIYDVSDNLLWTETHPSVVVWGGVYNVLLGSLDPIPDTAFKEGEERWLGVQIGSNSEMRPRQPQPWSIPIYAIFILSMKLKTDKHTWSWHATKVKS